MPWQVEPWQHACVRPVRLLRHHLSGHESATARENKLATTAKAMNFMVPGFSLMTRRSALFVKRSSSSKTHQLIIVSGRSVDSPKLSASGFYTF